MRATDAAIERDMARLHGGPAHAVEHRRVGLVRFLAARTDRTYEADAHDTEQRVRDHERLEPEIDEARDGAGGIVRVHGREHEVTGDGGSERDLGGLAVADLTDHDDVRVLTQDGAQCAGEGLLGLLIDMHLVDSRDLELDRVLDRRDVARDVLDRLECRVEQRGLAGARRPGDEHDALRAREQILHLRELTLGHAKAIQFDFAAVRIDDAHHELLASGHGQRRDAHVDTSAPDLGHEPAVLRLTLLGDVEVREHLQS